MRQQPSAAHIMYVALILSYSWQFCERDLEEIGHGLGEAVYRYHRMLMSKRLSA